MMYVTHDQAEALTLSDRIAVFEGGRVRQVADPRALYDRPADAFVAGFVGENNLLPGTIEAREEDDCRVRLACGPVVAAQAVDCGGAGEALRGRGAARTHRGGGRHRLRPGRGRAAGAC